MTAPGDTDGRRTPDRHFDFDTIPEVDGSRGLFREAAVVAEFLRWSIAWPGMLGLPRGCGRTVVVLPGFGAGDASTIALRSFLRLLGHRPQGWGLGTNRGNAQQLLPQVTRVLCDAAEGAGEPVILVGWSLGGYLAREGARERPEAVRRIVTMGSPVVGGPKYTAVAPYYRAQGIDLDRIEAAVRERDRVPLACPVTAIYSRRDGVVAWQACIDKVNPQVEHVEVRSTHVGLGFNPDVLSIVARRLAED